MPTVRMWCRPARDRGRSVRRGRGRAAEADAILRDVPFQRIGALCALAELCHRRGEAEAARAVLAGADALTREIGAGVGSEAVAEVERVRAAIAG